MQDFSISPREMIGSLWRHRELIYSLIKREVVGRYRGSSLGILWSFFNPVFMLVVYTFVFSVVYKARWTGGSDSKTEFALILFSGMIVFGLFSECVNRAPGIVLANVNYAKKVVFPLEILPFVTMGGALFHLLISFIVWLCFFVVFYGLPHLTIFLLPFVLLPMVFLVMGLSWFLASLGVYLRDVGQIVNVATTALAFLSPIFYPVSALPENYQLLLRLNPLTPVIEQTRQILMWGTTSGLNLWFVSLCGGGVVAWLGFVWFQKTRKGFSDVL
jgi:lipopolysaccharide transport system permease protein